MDMLNKYNIKTPKGGSAKTVEEAEKVAKELGKVC